MYPSAASFRSQCGKLGPASRDFELWNDIVRLKISQRFRDLSESFDLGAPTANPHPERQQFLSGSRAWSWCRATTPCLHKRATANFCTEILDFGGLDSSIISILRGGIPRSTGNFPEALSQGILVGIILVERLGVAATRGVSRRERGGRQVAPSGNSSFNLNFSVSCNKSPLNPGLTVLIAPIQHARSPLFKIHQRGMQWKQGVVIYLML